MSRPLEAAGALLCLVVALSGCGAPGPGAPAEPAADEHFFRGTLVLDAPMAEEIVLTDQFGRPFRLSEQRGKVVLIFFGYVQCPDVCPATLSTWSKVAKKLGEARKDVRFVYVTVDPERDSAERLRRHLEIFADDFIGLTGTPEEIEAVCKVYGVSSKKLVFTKSPGGYLLEHSSQTYLVEPGGIQYLRFEYDDRADDVYEDVRWFLEHREASLSVEDAWSRPAAGPGVIYLSIANEGAEDDRLVAIRTEVSENVEIHRTTVVDGRARMSPQPDGVAIPAGEVVRFEPGGLHVMLLGLRRELKAGDRFPAVLRFEKGGETTVEVEVRGL